MIKMFSKQFWVISLGWGILMAIVMTLFYTITEGFSVKWLLINSIAYVMIGGPLFAIGMTLFAQYAFKKVTIAIPENEILIKEYGANLYRGKEGVGGKIALTNKSVIFKSHQVNIQTGETLIPIQDISGFKINNRIFNFLNNELILITTEKDYRFIIQGRDELMEELKRLNSSLL